MTPTGRVRLPRKLARKWPVRFRPLSEANVRQLIVKAASEEALREAENYEPGYCAAPRS